MTPYELPFLNGATVEFPADMASFDSMLDTMKTRYEIDTITVYGLEHWSEVRKDLLFAALAARSMLIVPRVESYDPATFAFSEQDATAVVQAHAGLLSYLSRPDKRNTVAYIALNIPVDDGRIWPRLGGVNSGQWREAQRIYTEALVREARPRTADIPLYLSVFYGWDNAYDIPPYDHAGADGYFINNYSYPMDYTNPPYSGMPAWEIINGDRLDIAMRKFHDQYGCEMPLVVEYGFQTMEGHTAIPAQLAGLVMDRETKKIALRATQAYYDADYNVRGTMYFGYNIVKEEGEPPSTIDFTLVY